MKRHFLDFVGMYPDLPFADTFFTLMKQHPGICAPEAETHYFSSENITKGQAWYESHFDRCEKGGKRGEFATTYLGTTGVASRIFREYPDANLFALICDPLEAVATVYQEAVNGKIQEGGLEAYLERHPLLLEQFKFGKQLTAFFGYYSPVDLLVVSFAEVRANPAGVLLKLYKHIEIDPTFLPKIFRVLVEEEEVRPGKLARLLRLHRWRARRRCGGWL